MHGFHNDFGRCFWNRSGGSLVRVNFAWGAWAKFEHRLPRFLETQRRRRPVNLVLDRGTERGGFRRARPAFLISQRRGRLTHGVLGRGRSAGDSAFA